MPVPFRRSLVATVAALSLSGTALSGCSIADGASGGDAEVITIGYQSKTINTVTAGTLLRAQGYFEERLEALGEDNGKEYRVEWQDYDTGAPITAQMLAGKIDIGSMGDYPLLINGSTAGTSDDGGTEMVSVTGYNQHGALNGIVVSGDSDIESLADLEGATISASVGSAGHGTLLQALDRAGIDAEDDVHIENQQPSIGASALQSGSVDAVSQFVAWPGLLSFRDGARLVYDGGQLDVPTLHGVVVRKEFANDQQDVVEAFLAAQLDATEFVHDKPVEAAEIVAETTELPAEVVYLYNGRNGVSTFDPTLKTPLVDALEQDIPFLTSIGVLEEPVDLTEFVNDSYVQAAYGASYAQDAESVANPSAITGKDRECRAAVKDPATAGEIWVAGEEDTRPAVDAVCLLRNIKAVLAAGDEVRAAYVPDATTGTRWFADHMVWVQDGKSLLPFATRATARAYLSEHAAARELAYEQALEAV